MSFKEIYELTSLLQMDERDKAEIGKKKIGLLSIIKKQEGRLLHEVEEKKRIVNELNRLKAGAEELSEKIEVSSLLSKEIKNDSSKKIRDEELLIERTKTLINKKIDFEMDLNLISSKMADIKKKLMKNISNSEKISSFKISEFLSDSLILDNQSNKEVLLKNNLQNQLLDIEKKKKIILDISKDLLHQKERITSNLMIFKNIFQSKIQDIKKLDHSKKGQENDYAPIITSAELEKGMLVDKLTRSSQPVDRIRQLQESYQMIVEDLMMEISNKMEYSKFFLEKFENLIDMFFSNAKNIDIMNSEQCSLRNKMQLIKEEITSLKSKEEAYRIYSFGDKVEYLSFEAELIRSTISEMKFTLEFLVDQITTKTPSILSETIAKISDSLQIKEKISFELINLGNQLKIMNEKDIANSPFNTEMEILHSQEKSLKRQSIKEIETKIIEKEDRKEQITSNQNVDESLKLISEQNKAIKKQLTEANEDVSKLEINLENINYSLSMKENEICSQLIQKQDNLKINEKNKRLDSLKNRIIDSYQNNVDKIQNELIQQDKLFRDNILKMECNLNYQKSTLIYELEEIMKFLKEEKKLKSRDPGFVKKRLYSNIESNVGDSDGAKEIPENTLIETNIEELSQISQSQIMQNENLINNLSTDANSQTLLNIENTPSKYEDYRNQKKKSKAKMRFFSSK